MSFATEMEKDCPSCGETVTYKHTKKGYREPLKKCGECGRQFQ